jgi:hypothetical protein
MQQRDTSHDKRASLSPGEVEAILRRACAERDAALGRAIGAVCRAVAGVFRRFRRAVDDAYRLQALATLDDRRLAALGVARSDLPGIVYGWTPDGETAQIEATVRQRLAA